ncbi:PspC domain-containing protein [Microbacterium sp. STN6]|uniref:PspC domain-containing protein n=1 Tax=Microbacterium sp. STN6 TaxID=2995588 RepID=UPI0022608792|nr:PspC domain-containing protein [Microbacterium sp. STN6]MCX7520734.1 PspC domain-containing protein [Microbacterium sp. STN6]
MDQNPHPAQNRFFGWMRELGIVRQNGWIGGVCGGIAARLGIDPLIVRGIVVVIALFGGPVFLLYAAGWLLLPDAQNQIHLERLITGAFEPAIIGIGVLVLLTFLPMAQGVWWAGGQFWGSGGLAPVGHVLWTLIVIAAIVVFIVWATRRARDSRGGGARTASAPPYAPGTDAAGAAGGTASAPVGGAAATGAGASGFSAAAGAAGAASAHGAAYAAPGGPAAPPPPAAGASSEDYEAWRARQQEWKEQYAAWRTQADADQRAYRERRSAEMRTEALRLASEADAARRARRAANPRAGGAFFAITLGVALLAGGVTAAVAMGTPHLQGYEVTMGLAVATLAFGLAMIVAGAARRRSGFLAFIAILLSIATVLTALPPRDRDFVFAYGTHDAVTSARVFQPAGSYFVDATDVVGDGASPRVIDIEQWAGTVHVEAATGTTIRVVETRHGSTTGIWGYTYKTDDLVTRQEPNVVHTADGRTRGVITYGTAATPDVIVRVTHERGRVEVAYNETTTDTGDNR